MATVKQPRYELYYTDAGGTKDERVANEASIDITISDDSDDNDFELTLPAASNAPEVGATLYVDGTDIGGEVEGIGKSAKTGEITVVGRSWAGLLDARIIQPPAGEDYRTYSGDLNAIMRAVLTACDLNDNFAVEAKSAGKTASGRFDRYVSVWAGLRKLLRANSYKMCARWDGSHWVLGAVPVEEITVDAAKVVVSSDAGLKPINHMICGGQGELKDRQIIHLYADEAGNVSTTQTIKGREERTSFYDYSSAEPDELENEGRSKLEEVQAVSTFKVDIEAVNTPASLGDFVTVEDDLGNTTVMAEVTRVIVKISGGILTTSIEGGSTRSTRNSGSNSGSGGSSGGGGGGIAYTAGDGIKIAANVISADVTQGTIDGITPRLLPDAGSSSGILSASGGVWEVSTYANARDAMGLGNTTGALPVANGGTGATTAAAAINNLAPSSTQSLSAYTTYFGDEAITLMRSGKLRTLTIGGTQKAGVKVWTPARINSTLIPSADRPPVDIDVAATITDPSLAAVFSVKTNGQITLLLTGLASGTVIQGTNSVWGSTSWCVA